MYKVRKKNKEIKMDRLSIIVEKNQSQNIAFCFLEQTDDFKLKVACVIVVAYLLLTSIFSSR